MADLKPIPGSRRGRPGRPKAGDPRLFQHISQHSPPAASEQSRASSGPRAGAAAVCTTVAPVSPRLLSVKMAASYLGLSCWQIRQLELDKMLRRVRLELPDGRELRRLLFDIRDLDALIEQSKERSAG